MKQIVDLRVINLMSQLKHITSFLLIFAFTLMIANNCVFIGSGQSVLAFCYEMEDDVELKESKPDFKKETENFFSPFGNLVDLNTKDLNQFQSKVSNHFAEGHPSKPDLPPEL